MHGIEKVDTPSGPEYWLSLEYLPGKDLLNLILVSKDNFTEELARKVMAGHSVRPSSPPHQRYHAPRY